VAKSLTFLCFDLTVRTDVVLEMGQERVSRSSPHEVWKMCFTPKSLSSLSTSKKSKGSLRCIKCSGRHKELPGTTARLTEVPSFPEEALERLGEGLPLILEESHDKERQLAAVDHCPLRVQKETQDGGGGLGRLSLLAIYTLSLGRLLHSPALCQECRENDSSSNTPKIRMLQKMPLRA
jgi:hypothetical protein